MTDFGAPVPVTELPPLAARGGRQSNEPALTAWLEKVTDGATFELASNDEDKAHPVSRVTQLRKLAAPMNIRIDTRAIVTGKRYRIFATKEAPKEETAKNDKGKATTPTK